MLRNNAWMTVTRFIVAELWFFTTPMTLALITLYRRNRIIASLTKRVTAQNSTTGKKKTPQCAMGLNGLYCITGAGRGETTTWRKKRRDEIPIATDQPYGNLLYQQTNLHKIGIKIWLLLLAISYPWALQQRKISRREFSRENQGGRQKQYQHTQGNTLSAIERIHG